jgi:hypothetical protein
MFAMFAMTANVDLYVSGDMVKALPIKIFSNLCALLIARSRANMSNCALLAEFLGIGVENDECPSTLSQLPPLLLPRPRLPRPLLLRLRLLPLHLLLSLQLHVETILGDENSPSRRIFA